MLPSGVCWAGGNKFNNFHENQLMYPARGDLVWDQMRGCYLKSRGLQGVCITYCST